MSGAKHIKRLAYACFLGACLSVVGYYGYFRQLALDILSGRAPRFYEKLIAPLYPRFIEERARFDVDFIDGLVWQVFMRLALLLLIGGCLLWLYAENNKVKSFISGFWQTYVRQRSMAAISLVFYAFVALVFYSSILPGLLAREDKVAFYNPITFYKWFHIEYPSPAMLWTFAVIFGVCLAGVLSRYRVIFSALAALLFIYLVGFFHCFEKVDHGFALISYILLLLPFQWYVGATTGTSGFAAAWPLKLIQLVVAMAYSLAGMEKLMYSRLDFIDPDSFRILLQFHHMPAGLALSHIEPLMYILPPLVLLVQLSFPLILVFHRYKWFFLAGVFSFHLCVAIFLGLWGFVYLWSTCYIFFLPREVNDK